MASRSLPLPNAPHDGLAPAQRNTMIVVILGLHAAAVWGLLQVREVRAAAAEMAPMFVSLIAPEAPAPVVPPPPPPTPRPQPIKRDAPKPQPVIAAAPNPAPAAFVVPAPPEPPLVPPVPPEPLLAVAAAPAPPAPPPAPKVIPASAVQYIDAPVLVYPRASTRFGESGHVMVRVYIDTDGLPRNVQVSQSSGFARLDDAAVAAVKQARFKPYTENGLPMAGWAFIPLSFELEK